MEEHNRIWVENGSRACEDICTLCGVDCSLIDTSERSILFRTNEEDNFCSSCGMLRCRPRITYTFGCKESYRIRSYFFYFCPRGFSFVAGGISNIYGRLMGGIVAGPFLTQEEKGIPLILDELDTVKKDSVEVGRLPVLEKHRAMAMERIISDICLSLSERAFFYAPQSAGVNTAVPGEMDIFQAPEEKEMEGRLHESDMIFKVKQYVRSHYRERITLKILADHVFLSPAYLSSMFKQETGDSLINYINQVRVEASKPLLSGTDRLLADIAQECGFSDQSYFAKVFKKQAGMPPGKYRLYRK